MDVQILSHTNARMEMNNLEETTTAKNNNGSKKRQRRGKENEPLDSDKEREDASKRETKRKRPRSITPKKEPTRPIPDTESLLESLGGSLSDEVKMQLANSESVIQALATKMAEEMAAKRILEMTANPTTSPLTSPTKADAKEKTGQERETISARKEEERQRKEEEKRRKEEEKQQEKERRELEKQRKEAERLEKKEQDRLKKEADRLKREEEKQRKEEERKKRENEKRQKEEEKRKKEEEKKKLVEAKERQQSRIANFFTVKKPVPPKPVVQPDEASDYDSTFLPFYLRANVRLCEPFINSPETLTKAQKDLDELLKGNPSKTGNVKDWLSSKRTKRGYTLHHSTSAIIHDSNSETTSESELLKALVSLPQKFIRFAENVRPPYVGTFSKSRDGGIPRNDPFFRSGTGLNYDYDSEIEWVQEDEEGEDLDMDDMSEEGDDEDDDMDEFVADDDTPVARRLIVGPLTPTALWNDGLSNQDVFKSLEIDVLSFGDNEAASINPFHDYWTPPPSPQKSAIPAKDDLRPLALTNSTKKNKKLIGQADMKAFIHKIKGTDMNQIMLVETLKKE